MSVETLNPQTREPQPQSDSRASEDMGIEWDSDSRPLQEPGEELQQAAKPLVLLFKPKEPSFEGFQQDGHCHWQ